VGRTLADAPFVNTFSDEFQADPATALEAARTTSWLVQTPIGGLVIGRRQVQTLLGDRRLRSSIPDLMRIQGVADGPLHDWIGSSIIVLDGPDHSRLRKLVNRAFTPRAVDAHRPHMREVLLSLLTPLLDRGRVELMSEVADHYPIQVMCHLLGVPDDDHEEFARWNRSITWILSLQLGEHLDEVEPAMAQMGDYISGLVADRRRTPRDDLVSALVLAQEADDRLSDHEVWSMIGALLFAGYDTTRNQLGLAMWLFAEHPDQWRLLAAHPSLVNRAVEEVMRFQGTVRVVPRVTAEDLDFDGYLIPAGTLLMLSTIAANHDAASYDDPWTFDITADREPHLTFGGGPHYCLGASLARAELQEALPMLAAALPDLALDGEPSYREAIGIFGPDTLPLRFTPTGPTAPSPSR
jgi:hypothetical protein